MENAGIRLALSAALIALLSACGGGGDYEGDEDLTAATEAPAGSSDESSTRGRSIYIEQCQVCHGSDGDGSAAGSSLIDCPTCVDVGTLSGHISSTMPTTDPQNCTAQCAVDVANYILGAFNGVDVGGDTSPPPEPEPEPTPPPTSGGGSNTQGEANYASLCASCHAADGTGTPQGPSLIGCGSCTTLENLGTRISTTMPPGGAEQCVDQCATDTAEYILQTFNGQAPVDNTAILDEIILSDVKATFRKASLNLSARLPRQSELDALEVGGEQELDRLLDRIMRDPPFYARMIEIWNDFLLQNKYLGRENAISLLRDSDFPQRRWFDELGLNRDETGEERDKYLYLRAHANDAMAQEALRLISYIIENDLPITEMLTADYIIGNYYSARSYGVEGQHSWNRMAEPLYPDFPYDPEDYRPIRLSDPQFGNYPHAGVMTSIMFLNRFPTTYTNRNRHRSRMVYKLLLDTDVLLLDGTRPVDAEDINSPTPTLDNPNCSICHTVVDPVASIFQNWNAMGQFRPSRLNGGWYTDMEQRGFNGKEMPLAGNVDSSVRWLANEMATDARFPKSVVKSLHQGITGQAPLPIPDADVPEGAPERIAYLAQNAYFNELSNVLTNNNYNVRPVIKAIIMGPYFRADGLVSGANEAVHANSGSDRLLTPEMLNRKIIATTGQTWQESNGTPRLSNFFIMYGGMDSDSITSRITEPNGLIAATQRRMASQMACQAVAQDFFKFPTDRSLFPFIQPDESLLDENGEIDEAVNANVIANLRHLHWTLLGEEVAADDAEIIDLRNLIVSMQQRGRELIGEGGSRRLHFACDLTRHPTTGETLPAEEQIRDDDSYMLRSWQGILVYYLNDYRFVFE